MAWALRHLAIGSDGKVWGWKKWGTVQIGDLHKILGLINRKGDWHMIEPRDMNELKYHPTKSEMQPTKWQHNLNEHA